MLTGDGTRFATRFLEFSMRSQEPPSSRNLLVSKVERNATRWCGSSAYV